MIIDDIEREQTAREKRRWVRLTRLCNNRCLFCLDSEVQDGTVVEAEAVRREIERGASDGAYRLILSGGEPTLHPGFLEFLELGRGLGYGWLQTVSNGRRFAYPRFAQAAVASGLNEATFSMHGHQPELHDRLVAVAGAFAQSLQGMRNLRRLGAVVNIDMVINALNIEHLPAMVDFFLREGIREFDLLWPVPFGRAWQNRDTMLRPRDAPAPSVLEAIALARAAGATVWTNRLPPALLEGAEDLIQDPYKIHDEVRGRAQELRRWLDAGEPLPCRDAERCNYCFLEPFCAALSDWLGKERPSGSVRRQPRRVLASSARQIEAALRGGGELEIALNRETAGWVEKNSSRIRARPKRFFFSLQSFHGLQQLVEEGVDPIAALAPLRGVGVGLVDLPPCVLTGAVPAPARRRRSPLARAKAPGLDELVDEFIVQRYRLHSLRCKGCAHLHDCPGFPVNHVRRFGFSLARPVGR